MLFAADKISGPGETNESPFRWNLPSVSPSPVGPQESNLPSDSTKGKGSASKTNIWQGWRIVLLGSWFNLLLLLIPASWVLSFILDNNHKVIFIFSILSMIPLVKLHDLATRELALRIGGTKAGLLNASLSNTVEMVVAITALKKCELRIVQSSLIGSILSKLLLVLGMCFFAGGLRFSEQGFDQTATQIHSSLLSTSVGALLLPAAYHFSISGSKDLVSNEQKKDILRMSHGVSIVLMIIYFAYLLFQLWSHKHLYKDTKQKSNKLSLKMPVNRRYLTEKFSMLTDKRSSFDSQSSRPVSKTTSISHPPPKFRFAYKNSPLTSSETTLTPVEEDPPEASERRFAHSTVRLVEESSRQNVQPEHDYGAGNNISPLNTPWISPANPTDVVPCASPEPMVPSEVSMLQRSPSAAESFTEPRLSWTVTILLLTLVTITVAVTAEDLVESMDGISMTISKQWVGLILLPAVSSIAECVTAVNVSVKDQLSLSVSVAVGSSIQTTLLIIPFMVTLGWMMDRPLALLFDPYESVVLYISVQTMSYVVADGKSNWLEGIILICLYVIIAVSFWYYPVSSNLPSQLAVCG